MPNNRKMCKNQKWVRGSRGVKDLYGDKVTGRK